MALYPGMLSDYLAKWEVEPRAHVHCDTETSGGKAMLIDFHMYATLQLVNPNGDQITELNMTFKIDSKMAITNLSTGIANVYVSDNLPGRTLKHGQFAPTFGTLTFTSLQHDGRHSNTMDSMVNTPVGSPHSLAGRQSRHVATSVGRWHCFLFHYFIVLNMRCCSSYVFANNVYANTIDLSIKMYDYMLCYSF